MRRENSIVYVYFSSFIHPLMDIGGFYILTVAYSPAIDTSVRLFSGLLSSPFVIYLVVLELGHRTVSIFFF